MNYINNIDDSDSIDENSEIDKEEKKKMFDQYNNLPWTEKYRPNNLEDVVSHNNNISTLKKLIEKKCFPHLLFYGPPGTGKTSTITACAKKLYGDYYQFMVLELNASNDRGIEVVRNMIKQFVIKDNSFFGTDRNEKKSMFKLVILDEADAMTYDAQAILRKIVEKYTVNTRFCLICNYIQNINSALQSRCAKFRFPPLKKKYIKHTINKIIIDEKINISKNGINTIIERSNGDMRRVINILQATNMVYNKITEKNVNNWIGYPQKEQVNIIIISLLNDTIKKSYNTITKLLYKHNLYIIDIIFELYSLLERYIMEKNIPSDIKVNLSPKQIIFMLDKLRNIKYNKSINTTKNIQIGALLGYFILAKNNLYEK